MESSNSELICGDGLDAHLASDWPIGRIYRAGEPVVIAIDYSALGCIDLTAFLYVRCDLSCVSMASLLEPGARPLVTASGRVVVTHGFVVTSRYCDGSSELCSARDRDGLEVCALSLVFGGSRATTGEFDLEQALTDPNYRSEFDAATPSRRVQFGETCFGPLADASAATALPSTAAVPAPVQGARPFPPPILSCSVRSGGASCYDPYAGNVDCASGSPLYCQSPRGSFQCRPAGPLTVGESTTLYC